MLKCLIPHVPFPLAVFSPLHLLKATSWSSWSLIKKCNKCLLRSITEAVSSIMAKLEMKKKYLFANVIFLPFHMENCLPFELLQSTLSLAFVRAIRDKHCQRVHPNGKNV